MTYLDLDQIEHFFSEINKGSNVQFLDASDHELFGILRGKTDIFNINALCLAFRDLKDLEGIHLPTLNYLIGVKFKDLEHLGYLSNPTQPIKTLIAMLETLQVSIILYITYIRLGEMSNFDELERDYLKITDDITLLKVLSLYTASNEKLELQKTLKEKVLSYTKENTATDSSSIGYKLKASINGLNHYQWRSGGLERVLRIAIYEFLILDFKALELGSVFYGLKLMDKELMTCYVGFLKDVRRVFGFTTKRELISSAVKSVNYLNNTLGVEDKTFALKACDLYKDLPPLLVTLSKVPAFKCYDTNSTQNTISHNVSTIVNAEALINLRDLLPLTPCTLDTTSEQGSLESLRKLKTCLDDTEGNIKNLNDNFTYLDTHGDFFNPLRTTPDSHDYQIEFMEQIHALSEEFATYTEALEEGLYALQTFLLDGYEWYIDLGDLEVIKLLDELLAQLAKLICMFIRIVCQIHSYINSLKLTVDAWEGFIEDSQANFNEVVAQLENIKLNLSVGFNNEVQSLILSKNTGVIKNLMKSNLDPSDPNYDLAMSTAKDSLSSVVESGQALIGGFIGSMWAEVEAEVDSVIADLMSAVRGNGCSDGSVLFAPPNLMFFSIDDVNLSWSFDLDLPKYKQAKC